ncbi:Hint domain-containing protein [Nioella ostreopsis]|uniref:Hint domain-containing protein n=1 Tax=Nioella ostreopsis TaxID=2448479 RepID=UPI000FD75C76|nr:Hint domain-containing protein [Nioella ostreopsis]
MADYATTQYIRISNATLDPGTSTLTFSGRADETENLTVFDDDNSGTASTGDYLGVPGISFAGFTMELNGQQYAVFEDSSDGALLIPHNGEVWRGNVPPSPAPVTLTSNATVVNCFLTETQIATPSGDTPVEALRAGEPILTADGRIALVKWVGRQTVMTRFGPAERLMPVRFAAGSLGDGLPHSDLTVTADHGMLVDGVICHAGALVNGTTITRVPLSEMGETYTVYHIETEAHEIILANGAPAETFIDNVSRRAFDNFAEFEALYGDVPEMEELPYPRAMSARQVPVSIKSRLDGKAVA